MCCNKLNLQVTDKYYYTTNLFGILVRLLLQLRKLAISTTKFVTFNSLLSRC